MCKTQKGPGVVGSPLIINETPKKSQSKIEGVSYFFQKAITQTHTMSLMVTKMSLKLSCLIFNFFKKHYSQFFFWHVCVCVSWLASIVRLL